MQMSNMEQVKKQMTVNDIRSPGITVKMGDQQWTIVNEPCEHKISRPHLHSYKAENRIELGVELPVDKSSLYLGRGSTNERNNSFMPAILQKWRTSLVRLFQPSQAKAEMMSDSAVRYTRVHSWFGGHRTRFRSASRQSFLDTFQTGIMVGLILGCVCLIAFHPMQNSATGAIQTSIKTAVSSAENPISSFTVPALQVYMVEIGPFSSSTQTRTVLKQWTRHGGQGVIYRPTQGVYDIWARPAISSQDLSLLVNQAHSIGLKARVEKLQWKPQSIAGNFSSSPQVETTVAQWLSDGVTALNTLTGVLSDGGTSQDATTAYQTAKSHQPDKRTLDAVDPAGGLSTFATALGQAFTQYQQGKTQASLTAVCAAYVSLEKLFTSSIP